MTTIFQVLLLFSFAFIIVSAQDTNECTPGNYLTPSGKKCASCPPGTFQPDSGATGCIPCPKGFVAPKKGAASCTPCENVEASNRDRTACYCVRGYEFNYYRGKCKMCPPGTYNVHDPYYSYCETCPPGFYQPNKGATECLQCPAGSTSGYNAKECVNCPDGQVLIKKKCGLCPAGKFYSSDSRSCVRCYPGSYNSDEGTARDCSMCPPGSYSGYGYKNCISCADRKGLMRNGKCGSCRPGQYYSPYDRKCYKCEMDTFTPRRHVYPSCFNCGFSSFSFKGSSKCTDCKYGLTLLSSGLCGECPPGMYVDSNRGRKCVHCRANEYSFGGIMEYCHACPYKMYALPGSSSCTSCPEGQALMVRKGKCGVCPPGTYYALYNGSCERCESWEYQSEPGISQECIACPEGFEASKDRTGCVEFRR